MHNRGLTDKQLGTAFGVGLARGPCGIDMILDYC